MRTSVCVFVSGSAFVCPRAALDTAASDPSHHAMGVVVTFPLAFLSVASLFLLLSVKWKEHHAQTVWAI